MTNAQKRRTFRHLLLAGASTIYAVAFYFFYLRYVPLISGFQAALLPFLFLAFLLTAFDKDKGLLFFIFAFPLINNLPYFFGIFPHIPHAPAALVLFLAFFLGWMVNGIFVGGANSPQQERNAQETGPAAALETAPPARHPVFRPLFVFGILITLSGVITFFRFACYYPFRADGIYELKFNILGVSAGGAIMSTVFSLLNYLTGFAFFAAAYSRLRSPAFMKKALSVLTASTFLALLFAMAQKYISISIGNYPFWVQFNQINGTFKDPNSFGAFLVAVLPLLLVLAAAARGTARKSAFIATALLLLFVFPSIGARSAFLGLIVGLAVVTVLTVARAGRAWRKKIVPAAAVALVICVALAAFLVVSGRSGLAGRISRSLDIISGKISIAEFFNRRTYFWKAARAMMADNPISGVGLGAYIVEMPNYLKDLNLPYTETDSALNYVLQVGSELGWLGLAALAWLIWEILKQCRRSWREPPAEKGGAFLLSGALAGLAPFGVNFIFHTYIGSFEVKYIFWLLVAVVFALGRKRVDMPPSPSSKLTDALSARRGGESAGIGDNSGGYTTTESQTFSSATGKRIKSRGRKSLALTMFTALYAAVFAASLLWNSARSLSLETRTQKYGIRQEFGLDKPEKTGDGREFRWTGRTAGMMLRVEGRTAEIPVLASHPDIAKNPVSVEIYATGDFFRTRRRLDAIVLREGVWRTLECDLSEFEGRDVILIFKVSRTWNPKKVLAVPDPRNLGIALGQIGWGRSPKGHA